MHQYVDRISDTVITEQLFGDRIVRFLYSQAREQAPFLFRLATGNRMSSLLGFCNFDMPLAPKLLGNCRFLARCGVEPAECLQPPQYFRTPRRIFERQIRYWDCRPMPAREGAVVSPADSRVLLGSLTDGSPLFLKGKFFEYEELLGADQPGWLEIFSGADFAIFRLTPDKYHYNHAPVSGRVVAHYTIGGSYHSCNPGAIVEMVTPCSQNRRVVTIINTDVPGGANIGMVAMIEVVAMMIGEIVQCYSAKQYADPQPVTPGMFVRQGQPKSLYRPGSSTDVLLFQPDRIHFAPDLVRKRQRRDVVSRFTLGFGGPLVETEVRVRSLIATKK